ADQMLDGPVGGLLRVHDRAAAQRDARGEALAQRARHVAQLFEVGRAVAIEPMAHLPSLERFAAELDDESFELRCREVGERAAGRSGSIPPPVARTGRARAATVRRSRASVRAPVAPWRGAAARTPS